MKDAGFGLMIIGDLVVDAHDPVGMPAK